MFEPQKLFLNHEGTPVPSSGATRQRAPQLNTLKGPGSTGQSEENFYVRRVKRRT